MGGDAASPTLESAHRLETGMGPVYAPKGLHGQILGGRRVAHDAQKPAINGSLMKAEECLEGINAALLKLVQDVARLVPHPSFPLHLVFTLPAAERLHANDWAAT
jgi:hypothetical protein